MIDQRPAAGRSRRGRPPAPLQPSTSAAAQLGTELRAHRQANDLTLTALAARVGYSPQHISEVEHGRATVTEAFLEVCDDELAADGALMRLLPAVILEHARQRSARVAARRDANSNGDQEDAMDPTNRRDLAQAGATAALNLAVLTPPTRAGEVDPALPHHWERLLAIIGSHDAAHGPHDVLATARSELHIISAHRAIASGELRTALMRVEARWAIHAAWLCEDTGDRRGRAALLERALHLAREADYPDLIAWARARQAQWSDPFRAMRLAEAALRTPRAGAQTRALCAIRAAHAHAHLTDSQATERILTDAQELATQDSAPPPLSVTRPLSEHVVRCWEARCWAILSPAKGIALYDRVLRDWPRGRTRDGGLYLARLAIACADAGELDRARAEGRKAFAIARTTKSSVATRELKHLTATLNPDRSGPAGP
ncbi:MAG: helix-turn-helix domain-containing protein [Solirubrobacteraceae bacterium]